MRRGARINIPKEKTRKALYAKKCDVKIIEKIDNITEKTGVAKWVVIESILATSLGIKTNNKLDLKKWLKI